MAYLFSLSKLGFSNGFYVTKFMKRWDSTLRSEWNGKISTIRNFGIVAHVDHGKSTLADRILEHTGALSVDNNVKQVLDNLEVEKRRGITVKAKTCSVGHLHDNNVYLLNLVDTPGHSDFYYEVSRSVVAVCDGVILLVDGTQGVQAQTIANFNLAFNENLVIIPVINKIDSPRCNVPKTISQLDNFFGFKEDEILQISAKNDMNIASVLEAVVERIPSPSTNQQDNFEGLLYDSYFDQMRGVVNLVVVKSGSLKVGNQIYSHFNRKLYTVREVGVLCPERVQVNKLTAGQTGYAFLDMRSPRESILGDTLYVQGEKAPVIKFESPPKQKIHVGIYPETGSHYDSLKVAIDKLVLSDSSVRIETEKSDSMGSGWRGYFLGFLHLEIFQQRLEQEFKHSVFITSPSVEYKAVLLSGKEISISLAEDFPERNTILRFLEPFCIATVMCQNKCFTEVEEHFHKNSGILLSSDTLSDDQILTKFKIPTANVVTSTNDVIKRITSGFGSFDYEDVGYEEVQLRKIDIFMNKNKIGSLSRIFKADNYKEQAAKYCEQLIEVMPKHNFEIDVRAMDGGKIIAKRVVKSVGKAVLQGAHGCDASRRKKAQEVQNERKRVMKEIGSIRLPQEAFRLNV